MEGLIHRFFALPGEMIDKIETAIRLADIILEEVNIADELSLLLRRIELG